MDNGRVGRRSGRAGLGICVFAEVERRDVVLGDGRVGRYCAFMEEE